MNQQEIERLFRWAGFRWVKLYAVWAYPNEPRLRKKLPPLTWENIEHWFVPKLKNMGYQYTAYGRPIVRVILTAKVCGETAYAGIGESLMGAFLAALLKLVEAEEKNAKG